ncbi:MAG: tetratricopeptide repeat protein [Pirellulaceae bacterium]|nr:tetratricopeptide repeat protein [Pirellulaceae bacterium]
MTHRCCTAIIRRGRFVLGAAVLLGTFSSQILAAAPFVEPVVARVEMKLTADEKVVDVIEPGDLLTVIEERDDEYVIVTHDGTKGAVSKVNAVRIAESGDIYTELIQRHPDEGRYYTLRASSWWALGKAQEALDDFDQAIELGYTEAHAYTSRGLFHAAIGNYDEAIADYQQAIKMNPDDVAPYINRAAVLMQTREFDSAAKDYTTALKQKPDDASLLHQRAIAFKSAGEFAKAIADFDTILKSNERDITAVMGRGYIKFQQGDHQGAADDFTLAIDLNPEDAVARNNRGYNLHQIGQYAAALKDYNQAIKLAPRYALALQNRAWLLATVTDESIRDPHIAIDSARIACEITNYENVGDLSALAASLAAAGKFEDAVGWQEKVVEMVDANYKPFAEKTLARYENERPFAADPDKANADEKAAAEAEAEAKEKKKQANRNDARDDVVDEKA